MQIFLNTFLFGGIKKRLYFISVVFIFLSCSKDLSDLPYNYPDYCMHPESQIEFVKGQILDKNEPYYSAFIQLIYYADSILNVSSHTIYDYNVPGYYYDPIGHITNSKVLQDDAFNAYCSSLAYCLTGDNRYGQKACHFLNAWSYGNERYSGADGALVMSYSGTALLFAAELMSNKTIWKDKDINQFKIWVRSVYKNASNSIREKENNWGDWGIFGSLLSASFLKDKRLVLENMSLLKSRFSKQISPNGIMPHEIEREYNGENQALWYTYFAITPVTGSLWVIYNLTGENMFGWTENGKSIKKVIDNLLHYYLYPESWDLTDNKNFFYSYQWPDNLIEAMVGIYNDPNYLNYVESRRPIVYPYHDYVWVFPTLMPLSLEYN